MTLRKPDDLSVFRWMTQGLNLKTIIIVVCLVVGAHYAQGNRITVVEQREPELERRVDETQKSLDSQREEIKAKVDKDTYDADQRRLAEQFAAIRDSQGRIEEILMEQRRR